MTQYNKDIVIDTETKYRTYRDGRNLMQAPQGYELWKA